MVLHDAVHQIPGDSACDGNQAEFRFPDRHEPDDMNPKAHAHIPQVATIKIFNISLMILWIESRIHIGGQSITDSYQMALMMRAFPTTITEIMMLLT